MLYGIIESLKSIESCHAEKSVSFPRAYGKNMEISRSCRLMFAFDPNGTLAPSSQLTVTAPR
jgi:hypothetical protein